jgi:predicted acetyltransferase
MVMSGKNLDLQEADWPTVVEVLHDTYSIWSIGLEKNRYYHYIWWQLNQSWSRKNYRYLVLKEPSGRVVSSCKLYDFYYQSRGHIYKVGGIGAVFTPDRFRGNGYATAMLKRIVDNTRGGDYDALMLNSDIDPDFYGRLGFFEMGAREIRVQADKILETGEVTANEISLEDERKFSVGPVHPADLADMVRHHSRWLKTQPYALRRTVDYWVYKLGREHYLLAHSKRSLPPMEIIKYQLDSADGGYALIESSEHVLRILEVIGSDHVQDLLWLKIWQLLIERRKLMTRCWESVQPRFVKSQQWYMRVWAHPMLHPYNSRTAAWLDIWPCPLLELDHF